MGKICAFFGHRLICGDLSEALENAIRAAIADGATEFWVGGYGNFDSMAAGCVRRLKKEYSRISLYLIYAYLPTKEDPMINSYDGTIYPEGLELVPKRFAVSKRNQWIVRDCDMVIAYVDKTYGGAYAACQFAKKKGRVVVDLAEKCNETSVLDEK